LVNPLSLFSFGQVPTNSKILNLVSAGQRAWISKGRTSAASENNLGNQTLANDAVDWQVGSVMTEDG
jgi:hypothetical protein